MKVVKVVAAVIRNGDKMFATARGYGDYKGQWEFPGEKLNLVKHHSRRLSVRSKRN